MTAETICPLTEVDAQIGELFEGVRFSDWELTPPSTNLWIARRRLKIPLDGVITQNLVSLGTGKKETHFSEADVLITDELLDDRFKARWWTGSPRSKPSQLRHIKREFRVWTDTDRRGWLPINLMPDGTPVVHEPYLSTKLTRVDECSGDTPITDRLAGFSVEPSQHYNFMTTMERLLEIARTARRSS